MRRSRNRGEDEEEEGKEEERKLVYKRGGGTRVPIKKVRYARMQERISSLVKM